MSHGFSATISGMVADRFAEAFFEAGFTVLLYDHRGFGLSEGDPRCDIDPFAQAREYRNALDFASALPDIDPARLALWGDSLSGASAVAAAAVDSRVAAVVVQVPAFGSETTPVDVDGGLFASGCIPCLESNRPPTYPVRRYGPMPVVSFDQASSPSHLTPLTAYRWFIEYGGRHGTGWINRATVSFPKEPARWQPVLCAAHVKAPALFLVASDDEMPGAAPGVAMEAFERIPAPKELCEIEGGHFGLLHHPSWLFDRASRAETRFLIRHLS
jgi:pimeloyl-ACP methyl ester carboxylesterase